jgi:hypothetical protein
MTERPVTRNSATGEAVLDWIDLNNGDRPIKITTDPTRAACAHVDTYGTIATT